MQQIPMLYIKVHQSGLLIFLLLALILQQPVYLYILAVIQIISLLLGSVFVYAFKSFLPKQGKDAETQSPELTRFNNSLGSTFLTLALICLCAGWTLSAYILAGMFTIAVVAALLGYCFGCVIYYQINQKKAGF